jgi:hypothetical protein
MRNDQVKISFGPARYDSPKAIRKQIEDAKQDTQESTIQEIINNPELDIAGGAQARSGTVVSYTPGTGQGVAIDEFGETFIFTNGTGTSLAAGDEIVALESGDDYVAIGVTFRTGQVVPVDQPIGYLDPTFPITTYDPTNTGQLPLPIIAFSTSVTSGQGNNGHPFALGYDLSGTFGAGSDLIYGSDGSTSGSINGFSRTTATNVSLFPRSSSGITTGDGLVQFMQPNGTAVTWSTLGYGMSYRNPGDPGWTSESGVTGTTVNTFWAGDPVSGAVWGFRRINNAAPLLDTIAVYRFLPTDATIQSVGDMGIVPTTSDVSLLTPTGGNGFITFMFRDNLTSQHRYYVKAAGDTSNFTNCGTFASSSFDPSWGQAPAFKMAVSPIGETSYVYRDAGTGTVHLRMIDQSAVIYDNDTGIPTPATKMQMHTHLASGLVAVVATVLTSDLGDVNVDRMTAALATYNYATTSYQYYDISNYVTTLVGGNAAFVQMAGLQEVVLGEVRYIWGTNLGANTTSVSYAEIVGVSGL